MAELILYAPSAGLIKPNRNQAIRYMRASGIKNDEAFLSLIDSVSVEVEKAASPRGVSCEVELDFSTAEEGYIYAGGLRCEGFGIIKALSGCSKAVVFAATLGSGVDRLISRLSVTSPSKCLIADALASSMTESLCDYINRESAMGRETKLRFSPGYSDFPLSTQSELLRLLNAGTSIGLSTTNNLMLTPVKSVTAIYGIMEQ